MITITTPRDFCKSPTDDSLDPHPVPDHPPLSGSAASPAPATSSQPANNQAPPPGRKFGYAGPFDPNAEVLWFTEGVTNCLSLLSLPMPKGHTAICNVCGATENPNTPSAAQFVAKTSGINKLFVLNDCDFAGQSGATWVVNPNTGKKRAGWAPAFARYAKQVRNVVLPYPIEPSHGKDIRDWVIEQQAAGKDGETIYAELYALALSMPLVEPPDGPALEDAADDAAREEAFADDGDDSETTAATDGDEPAGV